MITCSSPAEKAGVRKTRYAVTANVTGQFLDKVAAKAKAVIQPHLKAPDLVLNVGTLYLHETKRTLL